MFLAPLHYRGNRFRPIDAPVPVALEDIGPSDVDPTPVPQMEASLIRCDVALRKINSQLRMLTIAQPNPLDDRGVITAETVEARLGPLKVELFSLLDLPSEVATSRLLEMTWPTRDNDFVE